MACSLEVEPTWETLHKTDESRGRGSRKPDCKKKHSCQAANSRLKVFLKKAMSAINHAYNVDLPCLPSFGAANGGAYIDSLRKYKVWVQRATGAAVWKRKGKRERIGGVLSVQLTKKGIPAPCKCIPSKWETFKACQGREERPEPSERFLHFVRWRTRDMFRDGWLSSKAWENAVLECSLSDTACAEKSRRKGGMAEAFGGYENYLNCLEMTKSGAFGPAKYSEVLTAGKVRALTMQPYHFAALAPLHKAIYDNLRKQDWLLVGPPTPDKLRSVFGTSQAKFLSGDYKAATDNLDLRVTKEILGAILAGAQCSEELERLAMDSLNWTVANYDKHGKLSDSFEIERGQMMGFYLSFPLLCLYNCLVTEFACGPLPKLVNGDDLVVRMSPESRAHTRWFQQLPSLGIEPEAEKTDVQINKLNINSTAFVLQKSGFVECRVVRTKSLNRDSEAIPGRLGEHLSEFIRNSPNVLSCARSWAKEYYPVVNRVLGLGVDPRELGFRKTPVEVMAEIGLLKAIKRHAKSLPSCRPFPPLQQMDTKERKLTQVRRLDRDEKIVLKYDAFFEGKPEKEKTTFSGKEASKHFWKEMRTDAPQRTKMIVLPRRMQRLQNIINNHRKTNEKVRKQTCLLYGDLIPWGKFMARLQAPTASAHYIPNWYYNLLPFERKWHLLALRWT